jgi:hypothetical protein
MLEMKDILDAISKLDQKALRELDSHIHKLLQPAVVYKQKPSKCGQPHCKKCRVEGKGHGLYWYAYFTYGGKTRCVYVGKEKKEIDPIRELRKKQKLKKGR